ncbi:hypothetical protein HYH03_005705 [Edaphochlamys debaryana]|uniref:Uncharacterized protein n=1 Tax=Edaphochlamys debaryana TaxID=47281 RepID=A0A835Y6R2_9CHLO|nr:hypothetical protein HYH03_005705 [Edaphochlamys debaryana]|eukprot:KAG2496102.1 hypothetical protein HYH03_005705 [Edaphochlamys debaryana]
MGDFVCEWIASAFPGDWSAPHGDLPALRNSIATWLAASPDPSLGAYTAYMYRAEWSYQQLQQRAGSGPAPGFWPHLRPFLLAPESAGVFVLDSDPQGYEFVRLELRALRLAAEAAAAASPYAHQQLAPGVVPPRPPPGPLAASLTCISTTLRQDHPELWLHPAYARPKLKPFLLAGESRGVFSVESDAAGHEWARLDLDALHRAATAPAAVEATSGPAAASTSCSFASASPAASTRPSSPASSCSSSFHEASGLLPAGLQGACPARRPPAAAAVAPQRRPPAAASGTAEAAAAAPAARFKAHARRSALSNALHGRFPPPAGRARADTPERRRARLCAMIKRAVSRILVLFAARHQVNLAEVGKWLPSFTWGARPPVSLRALCEEEPDVFRVTEQLLPSGGTCCLVRLVCPALLALAAELAPARPNGGPPPGASPHGAPALPAPPPAGPSDAVKSLVSSRFPSPGSGPALEAERIRRGAKRYVAQGLARPGTLMVRLVWDELIQLAEAEAEERVRAADADKALEACWGYA